MFVYPPQVIGFTVIGCGAWLSALVWAFKQRKDPNQWHHLFVFVVATLFWWLSEAMAIRLGKYEYAPFPALMTLPGGLGSSSDPDILYRILHRLVIGISNDPIGVPGCPNLWSVPFPVVAMESAIVFTMLRLSVLRFKGRGLRPALATAGFGGLLMLNLTAVLDPVVSVTASCAKALPHTVLNFGLWSWITYDKFPGYWFGIPLINYSSWFIASLIFCLITRLDDVGPGGVIRKHKWWVLYIPMVVVVLALLAALVLPVYFGVAHILEMADRLGVDQEVWQFTVLAILIAFGAVLTFVGRRHHNPEFKLIFWVPQLLVLGFCLMLLLIEPSVWLFGLWLLSAGNVSVLMGWPRIAKALERSKRLKLSDAIVRT